jgi:uncharacterized membrane protein YdcZ (DUF606 family)
MAFLTGCIVILSLVINSKLAIEIGTLQGALINYVVGLLFSILVLLFNYKHIDTTIKAFSDIPLWIYLGGFIGVMVILINNNAIPKVGAVYSTLLIFMGQLSMGVAIDFLIGNSISTGKIVGGLLILAGMLYNFHIDKKNLISLSISQQTNQ